MTRTGALPSDAPYTLRALEQMSGLGRGAILGLVRAGIVSPLRGPRNTYHFSFQDLVLVRMARALQNAKISPSQVRHALMELQAGLPQDTPLSGLRIKAFGKHVAVGEGTLQREVRSGQLLMDFDNAAAPASVSVLRREAAAAQVADALQWFESGQLLEHQGKTAAAEAAYRQGLALTPGHAEAYVNLGALLCDAGRFQDAVELFDAALQICPSEPLLHFNRAIALEDLQRDEDALAGYQRCLDLAPDLADAHYNAARLHEKLGQRHLAIRHYSAYRRLIPNAT